MYKILSYKIVKDPRFFELIEDRYFPIVTAFPGVGKSTLAEKWVHNRDNFAELVDLDFGNIRASLEDEIGVRFSSYSSTSQHLMQQFYISTAETLCVSKSISSSLGLSKPNLVLCNIPDTRYEAMVVPHPRASFTYVENVKKRDPNNPFAELYEKNFTPWVNNWVRDSFSIRGNHQVLYLLAEGLYLSDMYEGNTSEIHAVIADKKTKIKKTVVLVVRKENASKSLPWLENLLNFLN